MTETLHLLRIYVDPEATEAGAPYWKILLDCARSAQIHSAAALHLLDAFGPAGVVHSAKANRAGGSNAVILELLDAEPALRRFLETLPTNDDASLATLEPVSIASIARYGGHRHHHSDTERSCGTETLPGRA